MANAATFDREFKVEIAKQVANGKRNARSMARELGVHENTIRKWVQQYVDDPDNAFPRQWKPQARGRRPAACTTTYTRVGNGERDLKKSRGILCKKRYVRYEFVYEHRSAYTVAMLCRTLNVTRSGYYAYVAKGREHIRYISLKETMLLAHIRRVYNESECTAGYRKVYSLLRGQGVPCSIGRVR